MSTSDEPTDFIRRVEACFAVDGVLSKATSGFVSRTGQIEYAKTVAQAIETGETVILEAGTGTGKTFAYLTPALLAGKKVIVSTGGKPLQDQLFKKDLPALDAVFEHNLQCAVLKGRSNYICLNRLSHARTDGMPNPRDFEDLKKIEIFAQTDKVGDKNTVKGVAEDAGIWPFVTSTRENCAGKNCPFAEECFVNKARARARASDVVIVNHHLLLSSFAVKDEVDANMLPKADVIILDEAHKLPEIAIEFFGNEWSSRAVKDLVREIRRHTMSRHRNALVKPETWDTVCDAVTHAIMDFCMRVDEIGILEGETKAMKTISRLGEPAEVLESALEKMTVLKDRLSEIEDDSELEPLRDALSEILSESKHWIEVLKQPDVTPEGEDAIPSVRWIERFTTEVALHETPLSFAENFKRLREEQPDLTWIFTSATLASDSGNFDYFTHELGLEDAKTRAWQSPFDYPNQAMMYVPEHVPLPVGAAREGFMEKFLAEVWPVIDLVEGRTLMLCTSRKAMLEAAEILRAYVESNHRPYEVFVQSEDTRTRTLEKFRAHGHGILVATMSFWEGIDIKGDALSLVVIDKLPFAPKDDPVLEARCDWIDQHEGNAFMDLQVPLAAISFKQGVGRLIRSESDRGILIIGDRRVIPGQSRYGSRFLASIPDFSRTQRFDRVVDFWTHPDDWR